MPVPVTEDLEKAADWGRGGGRRPPRHFGGGGGRGRSGDDGGRLPSRAYRTAIWLAMAAMLMFFMSLSSAYIVRRGFSEDWVSTALPRILALNTLILLLSSFTIWRAVKMVRRRDYGPITKWLGITFGLGLLFLAGQFIAWRQLIHIGVYISTHPSSSFFYVLTAAHAVHLIGGLAALAYVYGRAARHTLEFDNPISLEVAATYWHFLDGAWLYLFLLLVVWR
jgi:cytochrome c oxidase subunit 3